MEAGRIQDLLIDGGTAIENIDGQWKTRSFKSNDQLVRNINKLNHRIRLLHPRLQLVFKDAIALEAFLGDTSGNLDPLQTFVRRVHGRAGNLVTTGPELEAMLHQLDPGFQLGEGPDWVAQLKNATVMIPDNLEYHLLTRGTIQHFVCARGAGQQNVYDWHFGMALDHYDALALAARRETQSLLEGRRAQASWREELTNLAMDVPVSGHVLVVPDDPAAPVLLAHVIRGVGTDSFGESATIGPQPVTFYVVPHQVTVMRCCSTRRWESAERILPLDVMAAA